MKFFHCLLLLSLTAYALGQQQAAPARVAPAAAVPAAASPAKEDFSDYDGPPAAGGQGKADGNEGPFEGDEGLEEEPEEVKESGPPKTQFSDDRFAKLFPSRSGTGRLTVRPQIKPKPTLPSFIKSTPELIKVEISTTPAPRGGPRGRVQVTPAPNRGRLATTTVRPVSNNVRNGRLATTPRPPSGRLPQQAATTQAVIRATPAPQSSQNSASAAALARAAAARRAAASRFSRNQPGAPVAGQPAATGGTVPALPARQS